MTEVAVTEALGEWLSPSRVIAYLTCPAEWYFRYLVELSEPATGALTLGKAFHATPARNFRQMITGRDVAAGEALNKERLVAVPQAALRDDQDERACRHYESSCTGVPQKPRESRTGLHREDD